MNNKKQRTLCVAFAASGLLLLFLIKITFASSRPYQPNIILITADSLRADHLGCYGYNRSTSPNIDKIAKEGILFTQAISHSSHTPPSMASIATGDFFSKHHVAVWGHTLNISLPTIAEIVKDYGYRTIFASLLNFRNLHGFSRGFDVFLAEDVPQDVTINSAIKQLEELDEKKFFLWVHYMGTHHPYFAPESFLKLFLRDQFYDRNASLPIVKDSVATYGFKGISESFITEQLKYQSSNTSNNIIQEERNNPDFYIAQYDASIRFFDSQVKILVDKLKELKLYENTVIIISSDHGELLGEHDYYFHHGVFLYDQLIKVPLIIKANGLPIGKIITQQVQASVDILPTILALVGINVNLDFDGQSLIGLILNNRILNKIAISDEGMHKVSIRTLEWKLIESKNDNGDKIYELYNLRKDPKELVNLKKAEIGVFRSLRNQIINYLATDPRRMNKQKIILDKEAKENLKSLGYVQ